MKNQKLKPVSLANSLALAFACIHLTFDLLSWVAPDTLKSIFNTWFHGFSTGLVILEGNFSSSLPKVIFGLLTSVVVAWVVGYLIAYFYNRFDNGKNN